MQSHICWRVIRMFFKNQSKSSVAKGNRHRELQKCFSRCLFFCPLSALSIYLRRKSKEPLINCCAQIDEQIFWQICTQNAGIPEGLSRLCGQIWRKICRQDACIELISVSLMLWMQRMSAARKRQQEQSIIIWYTQNKSTAAERNPCRRAAAYFDLISSVR